MKARGLIALAIVAVGVAVVLLLDFRHDRRGGVLYRDAPAQLLPQFDRKAVRSITIRRQGGAPFTLQHTPSPTAPAPAPAWQVAIAGSPAADDAAIEDLLSALDLAESDRVADLSAAAAELQPPAVEITIDAAGRTFVVQLGRPDVTGRGVYARSGGDGPIRVVSRRLRELADREASAFRDRRLFPVDPAGVTSIAWRDAAGPGELRVVAGRWQNARSEWVDEGRVHEALRRLFGLRIDRFDAPPRPTHGETRTLSITAGPARIALELGSGDAAGQVTRASEHLHVPADALDAALRALAAAEARDTRLLSMSPDVISSVVLSEGSNRVGLRRVNGAWTFAEPRVRYAADTRVVDDWLARLATLTTPTRAAGPHTRQLVVEGRFRQEVVVSSPADVYALLAPDPLRFRERALLSFARFDVRRLQRTAGKDVQVVTSDDGGTWRATSGAQVDAGNVVRVVGALSDLRADEFLDEAPRGEPTLRLEVDVQQPGDARPTRHVVELHPGCVARLDADASFKIERAACDALGLTLLRAG